MTKEVEQTAADRQADSEECRRQLEALRERETQTEERAALLESILAATPAHIYAYDQAGRYLYASPAGTQALGLRPEQMVGRTWRELDLPPEIMEPFSAQRETVQATGQSLTAELEFPTVQGMRQYEYHLSPLRGPAGQVDRVIATAVDITERRQAEAERERLLAAVEEQRRLFEAVIENVPAAVTVLTWPDLVYELVNPAYQAFLPGKEVRGRTLREVLPEIADQVEALMKGVMGTRQPYRAVDMPFPIRRAPGAPLEEAYFTFSYLPIRLTGGRDAVLVVAIETTEEVRARRRIEALAEASQQRATELEALQRITDPALARQGLEPLIHSLLERTVATMHADTGALMLLDPAGQELVLRATAGIPGEEIVGPTVRVGEDFAGQVAARNAILGVRDAQTDPVFSNPTIRASDIRGMLGAPLRVREELIGIVFVGFLQAREFGPFEEQLLEVVAERAAQAIYQAKLLEEARQAQRQTAQALEAEHRAREQAEAAVRARDDFLAASAHELRTPITNLRGYAQTTIRRLERAEVDPERLRQALQTIDLQSERLARLVQQLLDVADIEAGQMRLHRQETDLAPLVRDLVASVQAGTKRHTLTLEAPASLHAFVDPVRIEQVVANLLDNAVKFSPEGTPIEVKLATPEPGTVRLSVRDYGPGIPPELRPQLFSRFFQAQTGRPFAGLGLGLYYSRAIVELHGGNIRAEFPEDGGSRFVVELPREGTEGTSCMEGNHTGSRDVSCGRNGVATHQRYQNPYTRKPRASATIQVSAAARMGRRNAWGVGARGHLSLSRKASTTHHPSANETSPSKPCSRASRMAGALTAIGRPGNRPINLGAMVNRETRVWPARANVIPRQWLAR